MTGVKGFCVGSVGLDKGVSAFPKAFLSRITTILSLACLIVLYGLTQPAFALSQGCRNLMADWNGSINAKEKSYHVGFFNPADEISFNVKAPAQGVWAYFTFGSMKKSMLYVKDDGTYLRGSPSTVIRGSDFLGDKMLYVSASYGNAPWIIKISCVTSSDSKDASLSTLAISGVPLTPAFAPDVTSYTATVPGSVSSINVSALPKDSHATLSLNGQSTWGAFNTIRIPLAIGTNTLTVAVTAQDDVTRKTYAITVTRERMAQTISFTSQPPAAPVIDGSYTVAATSTSGLAPTLAVDAASASVCSLSGNASGSTIQFNAEGACVINADQAGDATYLPAPRAQQTLAVSRLSQSLSFTSKAPSNALVGETYTPAATSTSGLAPALAVDAASASVCSLSGNVSGSTVTFTAKGSCVINADQPGNATYLPAPRIQQIVGVGVATPALSLSVEPAQAVFGTKITLIASLSGGKSPTGSIEFRAGSTVLNTSPLTGSAASLSTTSLPVGSYDLVARYSGDNSNAMAQSNAVTVTISAPSAPPPPLTPLLLSPAGGGLEGGLVGKPYKAVNLSATGGSAPYRYSVTAGALPAGLSLDASAGTISGTPTTLGRNAFTITVSDSASPPNTASASASYSIEISAPPAIAVAMTLSPQGALPDAMAGEDYRQKITVTGGQEPRLFSLSSGTLPAGLVLNVSTGELTGPLAREAKGDYAFTVSVKDATNASGSATYTLTVRDRAVTVADVIQDVPEGSTPRDVYLNRNATGGPFVSADVVSVEPAISGTARVIRGQLAQVGGSAPAGWYLQFTPNPAFSGQARVGYRLTSALGRSNIGTVSYRLSHDAAFVAADMGGLVQDFVRARQSLLSQSLRLPGLLERRQAARAGRAVSTRFLPSSEGATVTISTSLGQIRGASDETISPSHFDLWFDGSFMLHKASREADAWGKFGLFSAGMDYLLTDRVLIGLSVHYDRMIDPLRSDAVASGHGWLAGPYASLEIGQGVFWDTSLLYGASQNRIDTGLWDGDFTTRRLMLDSAVTGEWALDETTILTPKLRAAYLSERIGQITVYNSAGKAVSIGASQQDQLRISLGSEIAWQLPLAEETLLSPKIGATAGFSGLGGQGLFAELAAGLSVTTPTSWTLDLGLQLGREAGGHTSFGLRTSLSKQF
ncbi:putative Ig domain-containing protein [Rhizobium sp. SSA_523]|uniref:putative Ig domain-containing protein n=1 Tax=Rhizobium sp. SSA_523 TaxID=2952477 RepID=UPI00209194CB|nr:putative Ig domain-containing protein [Rhizobium sp. SSA_523]MCO5731487.1 putative Ig domain-containing protein [Rhizobium sp. SSA_523]WKC21994.1 putative Ig domain-containing protein [Rhizobium sp. SSA_523]